MGKSEFVEGVGLETFHTRNRLVQSAHNNSLRSRDSYRWSEINAMSRFKNNKLNTWEKKSFQFQMHSAYQISSDLANVKNLYFLIQSSNAGPLANQSEGSGNFRGTVYLDDFEVKVRSKIQKTVRIVTRNVMNDLAEAGPVWTGEFRDSWVATSMGTGGTGTGGSYPYQLKDVPELPVTKKENTKKELMS